MDTCKDCICYPVCCKYDMYGDCAKERKYFAGGKDWVKPVRCKDCKHCRVTTLQNRYGVQEKLGFVRTSTEVKTRKKLLIPIVIVVSQKGQTYEQIHRRRRLDDKNASTVRKPRKRKRLL